LGRAQERLLKYSGLIVRARDPTSEMTKKIKRSAWSREMHAWRAYGVLGS